MKSRFASILFLKFEPLLWTTSCFQPSKFSSLHISKHLTNGKWHDFYQILKRKTINNIICIRKLVVHLSIKKKRGDVKKTMAKKIGFAVCRPLD